MSDHSHCLLTTLAISFTLWARAAECVPPQPHQIPLSSIVTTSGQKELQSVHSVPPDGKLVFDFGPTLQRVLDLSNSSGASNTFLVDAPTIAFAIGATAEVFSGRTANIPVTSNGPNPPRGNHWLVVYLGVAGSGPVRWIVDSVSVEGGIVRFSYHKSPIGRSTADCDSPGLSDSGGACVYAAITGA
jgi:hypothetical protein